ncbi:cation:proton antiporter [Terriglobus sp.]|uniref:cation:proton antiporter n=1 Tax=Terriglobus sp. TaxID=1889013 RepID=UPI003B009207
MTFFESLLVLLFAAVVLLQVARRLRLPYPAMLAAAGVAIAFIPGVPNIPLAPETALAIFIAPVIVDAAYDFPLGAARRLFSPLLVFAVLAVLLTAGVVAWLGHSWLGIPVAAALTLGAIVAPPDAAAATAVLSSTSIPRSTETVLKGESLFNDATALLVYSTALSLVPHAGAPSGMHWSTTLRVLLAAPGGIALGYAGALLMRRIHPFVKDTLGGNLLQFCTAYLVWIFASRLQLSAVLCVVTFAMVLARTPELIHRNTRMRVQSFAVWSAVVFALNVFAFLLMGMQVRNILGRLNGAALSHALHFAALVVAAVVMIRFAVVITFNRLNTWLRRSQGKPQRASLRQAVLVGWCGMRGFVTLATAFALPQQFPQRDTLVLAAFSVVLVTLVLQGMTLGPMIRMLGLDETDSAADQMKLARQHLAHIGRNTLQSRDDPESDSLRFLYGLQLSGEVTTVGQPTLERYRLYDLIAVRAERKALEKMREDADLSPDLYLKLQEELDWRELTLLPQEDRLIEEG